MTKRSSEGDFGAALRAVAPDIPIVVYKPPDDARNMKPCDYMTWTRGPGAMEAAIAAIQVTPPRSAWFECKDTKAVHSFPYADIRPSQHAGIADAERIGIPYWLAVYWRVTRSWTISDAKRVLAWRAEQERMSRAVTSIPRELLHSRFGIDSTPANLTFTLKSILRGEV